ncbi:hypothetical protein CYY_004351 [Polysphondylium violaceum]|uniref:Uncharacterized protein n=1 Tax=Polysphondylium violaceum TaxID=133409 RepID=A0A8J4PWC3_9MYCE|nr:hypothetical protein CYY_004351 [Polysphondylium violaceum]
MDKEISITIQKKYNDFQDLIGEIDYLNEECCEKLETISNFISTIVDSKEKLKIKLKEPMYQIKNYLDNIEIKIEKMYSVIHESKSLISFNKLNDINLLNYRGKLKSEVSVNDLIEFMNINVYYTEQDYQMKLNIFIKDLFQQQQSQEYSFDIAKIKNSILLFRSKTLMNQDHLDYVTSRINIYNSILKEQ